jgi:hypothetical protein
LRNSLGVGVSLYTFERFGKRSFKFGEHKTVSVKPRPMQKIKAEFSLLIKKRAQHADSDHGVKRPVLNLKPIRQSVD